MMALLAPDDSPPLVAALAPVLRASRRSHCVRCHMCSMCAPRGCQLRVCVRVRARRRPHAVTRAYAHARGGCRTNVMHTNDPERMYKQKTIMH